MVFRSYPQLIQAVFNQHWFGPPPRVNGVSPWPWVDHSASRLVHATESPYSDSLSLRLHPFMGLNLATSNNSPAHYAKGTRSGIDLAAHSPLTACKRTVSGSFHSPPGVLFTFPSRYWFTIGRQVVFSLTKWSSRIPTGFLVSRGT